MKLFLLFLSLFTITISSFSQELNCRVQVSHQAISGTNKEVFQSMQKDITEFMNNRKWTNHVYSVDERIECTILINLTSAVSSDEFKGTIQIQSNRPIYNTSYNSVILNHKDNDFHIKYVEFQPLEFNESTHTSNLSSILAYYAYIIIGLDYDTYSSSGGSSYFSKAEKIVNNAQNASEKGWKAFENLKNRYWLVENLKNNQYDAIRECLYTYHRLGLDVMSDKVTEGRAAIAEAIESLKKVHRSKPGSFLMKIFFTAKSEELIKIFSEGFPDEKNRVVQVLKEIDPANSSKYQKILQNK